MNKNTKKYLEAFVDGQPKSAFWLGQVWGKDSASGVMQGGTVYARIRRAKLVEDGYLELLNAKPMVWGITRKGATLMGTKQATPAAHKQEQLIKGNGTRYDRGTVRPALRLEMMVPGKAYTSKMGGRLFKLSESGAYSFFMDMYHAGKLERIKIKGPGMRRKTVCFRLPEGSVVITPTLEELQAEDILRQENAVLAARVRELNERLARVQSIVNEE